MECFYTPFALLGLLEAGAQCAPYRTAHEKLGFEANGATTNRFSNGLLEFEKDNIRYIVSIKSGPNWGNSSQIAKMPDNFGKAKRILSTNTSSANVVAVNGCCYGKDRVPNKGDYFKLCGQRFWEFISGEDNLYTDIIEPLGHRAKEKNEQFSLEYAKVLSKFTGEFITAFCDADGNIRWKDIVKLNSAST